MRSDSKTLLSFIIYICGEGANGTVAVRAVTPDRVESNTDYPRANLDA